MYVSTYSEHIRLLIKKVSIMKNISYVVKNVAVVAIVLSGLLFASCKDSGSGASSTGNNAAAEGGSSGNTLPIAYVRIDSLLTNYDYAKDVNERMQRKAEDIRVTINQKRNKLEKDAAEFQRKVDNNAFLSQERAQQEYARIMKQQQDLEETGARLQNEWANEQMKENMQIADSVKNIVKLYNETAKYEVIFNVSELENIILANPKYDITQDIISLLNSRYKPESKK